MKIDEAINRFAKYISVEKRLAATTVQYYVDEVKRFAQYLKLAEIENIEDITAQEVRQWQMSLLEDGEAPGTVIKQIASLRAWFKYLRKQGWLDTDIMARITPPKRPKRLPIFFRESEVEKIYNDIYPEGYDGELHKLVLRLLYETGMRRSELANLPLSSIDLTNKTLKIRGKRNKERFVPIENELANNISRYITLRNKRVEELKLEGNAVEENDHLLLNNRGKAVSDYAIYTIVRHYMDMLSNAERTSPHVFRHSFATHMLNEGANIDAIKELLGHSDLAATEVYTHVTREHLKETYKHAHPRALKNKEV